MRKNIERITGYFFIPISDILENNKQIVNIYENESEIENNYNSDKNKRLLQYSFYEILMKYPEILETIHFKSEWIKAGYFTNQDILKITNNSKIDFFLLLKNNVGIGFGIHAFVNDMFCSQTISFNDMLEEPFPEEIKDLLKKLLYKKLKSKEKKTLNLYLAENLNWLLDFIIQGKNYKEKDNFQINYLFFYDGEGCYIISVEEYKNKLLSLNKNPIVFTPKGDFFECYLPIHMKSLQKQYLKQEKTKKH